ncbi:MAG: (Fe-S)-binding protein [Methanocellales archaeon]|nr:(Fe-S)-binding protein [Methanocellales archaeon]MDD3420980.1 (Fe-S)-binding protein [Methanocellales archaeon]MDD4898277.1 (Fe-S)-binding protein [Methanocellales archaeon]MDD5446812.1 (Fe-S)-binding protein [Methanocellales archaeon]
MSLENIVNETKAYYCLECGKCTGSCPISRVNKGYSPRLTVEKALLGFDKELLADGGIWSCMTCNLCKDRCPSNVDYTKFIRYARAEALKTGYTGNCTHGGVLSSLMRIMGNPNLKQDRLGWVSDNLKISEKGDILYFTGCLPYFETLFKDIGVNSLDIARSTVKILNRIGIKPVVMPDERCCGHDLFWTGDLENFEKIAKLNVGLIRGTGAKKVIFSCPECYRTFKQDYSEYVDMDFELVHISEFLAEKIDEGKIDFGSLEEDVTYQDPCRLGRHLGVYDPPRKVISSIQGIGLIEMEHSRERSICCGTSTWTNCDRFSEQIQKERLKEAKAAADTLITACPKCQIHLSCAMKSKTPIDEVKIKDFSVLVASAMGLGDDP